MKGDIDAICRIYWDPTLPIMILSTKQGREKKNHNVEKYIAQKPNHNVYKTNFSNQFQNIVEWYNSILNYSMRIIVMTEK